MDSSLKAKPESDDSENASIIKKKAVEGLTCDSETPPRDVEKSNENTNDSPREKIDSGIIADGHGKTKHNEESGSADVVMAEGVENGDAELSQHVDKSCDPEGEAGHLPGSKSELVVLDEVEESLDDKEGDGNTTSSKEVDLDAKSSSAGGENSTTKDNQSKNVDDPYAYVKREDFTSEKYKIEIRGLPRFYGYGELKKFLNDKLKLSSHKMKPTRNKSPWVFVCFKNEEDRQAALKTLNRLQWKGKTLTAMTARPAPDPLVKKRKLENEAGLNQSGKKPRISDEEKLRNSTTPYWNLSYDEQLKKKYDYVMKIMCKLADQIMNVNPMLGPWIKRQKAKYKGMACNLQDIRKSPTCDGYRNKCEFTIGINEETKQRMVGFRLGSYVQGHVGVGPINALKHIPQRMKETVKVFEKFIIESEREPFNPETHTGHWRQLTLRLTTLDELMAVVLVNSKGMTPDGLALAKEEVKSFFQEGEGKDLNVNALYFQAFGKREAGKEPPKMEHLLGSKYITESILGLKFRISPEAFFQVNTPGASILYSTVSKLIDLNPSTTIVDVCCGTGTIGLSLAKECGQVLGLEAVPPAIEDAKVNAVENNITNSEFFTGRAEEILTSVLSRAKGKSVHAIVDPPRSGLQQKAIVSLRGAEVIDKIIYVSCDPNAALKNFIDLARQTSKAYHGYPLVPVTAIPVDMFPHTAHCEVVMLFHRVNPINLPKTIPVTEDDIAILSETLKKSPQKPLQSPDPEQKEDTATENSATENSVTETNNDNKTSESTSSKDQKESVVSNEPQAGDRQKPRRKRPGRNQRLIARNLLGGLVSNNGNNLPGPKFSQMAFDNDSTAFNKPDVMVGKPEAKNTISAIGRIEKLAPKGAFKKDMPGNKDHFFHNSKPYGKWMMREKNFNPRLEDPGSRKWRKDDEPPMRGDILHNEELWQLPQVQRGSLVLEDLRMRQNFPRRGPWKDKEGQHRDMHSRLPLLATSRDGITRRSGGMGPDENAWLRREQGVRNWVEERERPSESPARKLLRRDDQPLGLEMTGHNDGHYRPTGPDFREEWPLHADARPLKHESRLNGKDFHGREEDVRFGRMRSERSPLHEPDTAWGKRRRRASVSPVRRYESDEFRGRVESERWGPVSDNARCENEQEGLIFRRRYSGEVEECGRPDASNFGERHSRRSCERFNRRSPEMLKRRSSDRFDRRFCERFERRSVERFERRSMERFNRRSSERFNRSPERFDRSPERFNRSPERFNRSPERFNRSPEGFNRSPERFNRSPERFNRSPERFNRSPERFDRSPCVRCDTRSSERVCRPQQGSFVNDAYREGRQESVIQDDFIGSRPNRLLQQRETIEPKYPQQMELPLHRPERYNEPETSLSVNYRESRNSRSANERAYVPASSPPRQMVGIVGSGELHRKNEVSVYRDLNDASGPPPLDMERRIPALHSGGENRSIHYEKQYESSMLHRSYDGEEHGGQNDHSVIARRVNMVRRPLMMDEKRGMLLDTSGKSLGTAEVLVVTAKNQMYDGNLRNQFNPNEGMSSTRILEAREMHKPWNAGESLPPAYLHSAGPVNKFGNHPEIQSGRTVDSRPQGNWTFERGLKELPRPWGEMARPNPVRDQPSIPDANISKFRQDVDERNLNILSPHKNPGTRPNAQRTMEKPFSYSNSQGGYGPKVNNSEPNYQAPPTVASHLDFPSKIIDSFRHQNVAVTSVPPSIRMAVPYHHVNSSAVRPTVYNQNPSTFMGPGMQATHQLPSLAPKQSLLQGSISDISNQQRMSSITSSAPESMINSWSFKAVNPWDGNNQQMTVPQKRW